jgi:PKD repeat protein
MAASSLLISINMKTLTFLSLWLIFLANPMISLSQLPEKSHPGRVSVNAMPLCDAPDEGGLKAAFGADVRSGFPPLTVNFIDQSEGDITSWNWSFGDGQTSEEQNPIHTFNEVGTYSISLTVSDGANFYTLEKENYITVKSGAGQCDTLDYPFAGNYTYYTIPAEFGQGYVSGSNSYGDLAKANYFNPGYSSLITGAFVDFAVAKDDSGTDPDIKIAVWNNAGQNGSPGSIIGQKMVPLSQIIADVNEDIATWILFEEPFEAGSSFYVGAVLPDGSDTLAFWTDTHEDSPPGKGWEHWDDGTWHAYSSAQSWGLEISNAIHPVVCQVTGTHSNFPEGSIAVYPVPARNKIYISSTDQAGEIKSVELFDMTGNLCFSQNFNSFRSIRTIPLNHLSAGLYVIKAVSENHVLTQKVLVSK